MTDADLHALIAAATAYEQFFVPAIFQEWAPRVADAAGLMPGFRVLDVACGTGVLARTAAERVGPTGSVAGVDINPGMLTVAARVCPTVEWRQAPAEALPYPDRSFDRVVSQFGLMFFRDRRLALQEMERVLTPHGRLAVAVWDAIDHVPAYATEVALLERFAGAQAADAMRAPFVLGDRETLGGVFAEAGMGAAQITTEPGIARFPSVRSLIETDLRGWLPLMGVGLSDPQIEAILAEAEVALAPFVGPDGWLAFDSPAHIVTFTKSG